MMAGVQHTARGACADTPAIIAELVATQPPCSNTGAEITTHWLRGGFQDSHDEILALIERILPNSYIESFDYGKMGYKRQHVFTHGLRVYFEPSTATMPLALVECPGEACEVLGRDNLQVLFCNSKLTRHDIAFDHAPFTPREVASWVREGNIRCRAKRREFREDLSEEPDGETFYLGSRQSNQLLRVYDSRGFTRVELELKGEMAANSLELLLASPEEFIKSSVGVLREFVDFVDTSDDHNVSRAPLLPLWSEFTQQLERAKIRAAESVTSTFEKVEEWLKKQVSPMLKAYSLAGGSIQQLLQYGNERMKRKHRRVVIEQKLRRAMVGAT